ncbi:MAG: Maleylacetoacetate isomerase [Myxococcaceae bacterium]|nr:Maleylacetoacetate isomerase [Myxococcaceae bacterium]
MKLYQGWKSSASWRVRWALAIKGLAYESVWLDIASGEHRGALAQINPLLTVPTLCLDDGEALTESVAILEWLEEMHPEPPLLPREPHMRARVRELVQLVNADIHPLQNTLVRKTVSSDEDAQNRWAAKWIERGMLAYEAHVARRATRFSVGDDLTMAELYLVPQVVNAYRFGADITSCQRVREIYERCLETPEARATHPDRATIQASVERAC